MKLMLHKMIGKVALFVLLFMSILSVSGQDLPQYDGINYTAGAPLQTQLGWTAINTGDDILIGSGSLSYAGLQASVGNSISFSANGIDAARLFAQQTTGTIYYSFLLNVTALGTLNATTGGYFSGFTEGTGNNFGATVWTRSDGAGYDIGLNARTTTANTVWTSGTTSINTTVLVVVSYQLNSGAANDVVKIWINPTPGSSEPAATLSATNTGGTDLANLNRILIRQDSASNTPSISMDELRVGTTWESVTPSGISIVASGTLASLNSTYGTASATTQFVVSGTNLSEGIAITPPVGFEVATSSDFSTTIGTNTSSLVIGGAGNISDTDVYVRLVATASVGNYTGNIVLSSAGASSVNVATNGTNTISAKGLTISGLTADDKTFDNNTTATLSGTAVLVGVVAGDEANVILGGTPIATFNDATVGDDKPVTVTGYTISGSASTNYTLTQPTGLTASILPSGLQDQTITFNALTPVTYGVTPLNLTATSDSNLTVTFVSSDTNIATIAGNVVTILAAGSVTITAQQAGNGSYNPAADVPQVLVINQKALTITGVSANDKVYDATTTATITGGSLVGVINADEVSFSGGGTFATSNAGSQSVTGALVLAGTDAANYILTQPVFTAEITSKEVTISGISIANKEYDTTTAATITGTPSLVGVLPVDISNISLQGSPIAVFSDASVGDNKPVTVSGYLLSGDTFGNYFLTQPTGLSANITLISLDVVGLTANNKEYDRTTPTTVSGTASLSGILAGDEGNVFLAGSPTANFDTATAGTNKLVTVTGYSLSGTSLANYTLAPLTLIADITKKDVTINSPSVSDKNYDGTTTASLSGTLNGVIVPDVVTLNLIANFADANVGTNKPVTSTSTLSDVDALNYNLVQPLGLTASIIAGPCTSASSGIVTWNFATASPSTNTTNGIAISDLSRGNNNWTTALINATSPSNYVGASATNNAGAAVFVAPLNTATSTYFEFTLTPQPGYNVELTGLSFGSRSTGTGPQAYTLLSSLDGYGTAVASGTLLNNSVWVLHNPTVVSTVSANAPITYRLYGHSGAGVPGIGSANWRIDDVTLNLSALPALPLSSPAATTTCSGDTFSYTPTSVYPGATFTWTRAAVAGISNAAVTTPQTSNPSEILVNTTNAPIDVIYTYTITTATCFLTQNVTVTVNNCSSIVNLKLFIEGYYVTGNTMTTVFDNQNSVFPSTSFDVELITVELRDATTPYALVASTTAMLQTDGTAICAFPTSPSGSYYIAVKTNNTVQTWSKLPQTVGASPLLYDFTTAASQAFGDNMVEIETGVFAFYSGDINESGAQDDLIDSTDYSIWETDNNDFAFGVYKTDLNGDGLVDSSDFSIWEGNNNNFIFANYPTP